MIDRFDVDVELVLGLANGLGETVASLSPVLALLARAEGDANAAGATARAGGDLFPPRGRRSPRSGTTWTP